MWLSRKRSGAVALAIAALGWCDASSAEVKIVEIEGWKLSTDGRVNAFVSHVYGDDRPKGLESLPWVGFNESGDAGQTNADHKLQKTRIRSGYVPSTLAFNIKKELENGLKLTGRVEVGFQIANVDPTYVADPTWMDPRAVYLDIAGSWGSVRAGRDMSLFPRGNLFMNYELGHAYGVGFPCAYEKVFGGACGHVGFGTLWPDFRAQIAYTTPDFGEWFNVTIAALDPRTVPTYGWTQTPLPRFEGEMVLHHTFSEGFGFKAWGNGSHQLVAIGVNEVDPATTQTTRKNYSQHAYGVGGGLIGYLGPVKIGGSGYAGRGMDAFEFLTFNPIFVGQDSSVGPKQRRFRPTRGFLAEASLTIGNTWFMGGFGAAFLDRVPTDIPISTENAFPLLRRQTGISAGVFHRIDNIVIGLDYFNANYGFDPRIVRTAPNPPTVEQASQVVHVFNGGVTFEW